MGTTVMSCPLPHSLLPCYCPWSSDLGYRWLFLVCFFCFPLLQEVCSSVTFIRRGGLCPILEPRQLPLLLLEVKAKIVEMTLSSLSRTSFWLLSGMKTVRRDLSLKPFLLSLPFLFSPFHFSSCSPTPSTTQDPPEISCWISRVCFSY